MREIQLFDDEGIGTVFADIEALSVGCRFRDCRHQSEPGCAVLRAIAAGDIAPERLDHYLKMETEARDFEARHDERLRRAVDRSSGKQHARDLKTIYRLKRGR